MPAPVPRPVVLHLISSLKVGGAERLLVSSMQARGTDVDYLVVVMNEAVDPALHAELAATGIPVYRLGRPEGHMHPKYLAALLKIVDRHGVRILHTHNEGSRFWGMLARLMRPALRLVYTIHSEGDAIRLTGWKRWAYRRLVDASVAISPFIAEETRPMGVRNLTLVENGVPLERFAATRRPMRTGTPPCFVSVGRFAPAKGQDILIEAFAAARRRGLEARLVLAGVANEPEFHARLTGMIASLGLGDRVSILLDRTDVETILAGADIFVLPSREEGFGLALVEAMAAGLPVIAARTGGAAGLVSDGINGLSFTPGAVDELAEAMMRLAGAPELCRHFADRGRETAGRYDIRATVEAQARLYRQLAA